MSVKHIPEIGERDANSVPGKTQWAHVTVGPATTCDVVVGDVGDYQLFDVNEPVLLVSMWTQVETAFTASVVTDLGASGSSALYDLSATVVPQSTGAVLIQATGLAVPLNVAGGNDILIGVSAATVAAGLLSVYVEYAVLQD